VKAIALATMLVSADFGVGQWVNHPGRGVPRTPDKTSIPGSNPAGAFNLVL
jgi:hypothetical protein